MAGLDFNLCSQEEKQIYLRQNILDKGYDYVGRAENNTGPTENYADKTT